VRRYQHRKYDFDADQHHGYHPDHIGCSRQAAYLCSINLIAGAPDNVALVEGTGTICGTGTAGIAGGTTAATGWNFAANGGLTLGNGFSMVARTATAADNVCLMVSSGAQVSGSVIWAQF